ncbi:SEC-C metal-binding domain-containing protein [Paenibacillus sp. HB172176]|uniref:helix-turn-helix domain-containing protein n=1 Tax=Paenibacillus sp. HB172176 TaxID=2493690 RepID=UPI00143C4800|nr:SEC-C metal-binding domain-containing protein [Paenibacillus sp. HB172176]
MAGRNDPCPCGSGKKYKQCCLVKQSEDQARQVKEQHFFDRKYKLTRDLYTFLAQKNGGEWAFDHQKYNLFDSSMGNMKEGLGNMKEFFFRQYDNGMRGIDCFLEERGARYSGAEREMLEKWSKMRVSCFQVVDLYEMIEPFLEDWCIHGAMMWGHPTIKLIDIGKALVAYRIYTGISQQELAARLNVSEAQVSRDERHEYYGATKERIQEVMQAMNSLMCRTTWRRRSKRGICGRIARPR